MHAKTILVVDDHAPTREAYASFLVEYGYRVLQAAHGGEAILHVHRYRPDLVLMDINMPVLDGIETAESLREHVPPAALRIVALTGCESLVKRERMHAVCDDVLQKPCAPDVITSRIQSLIGAGA
ncbi:MAG TPA: response regulator [Longimicrobium sp.]|jgi:CheY-like chemotaxis protein|nr:response regulator [Longimicrobium sp.]